ncbi:DNA-binding NarL/FixJ family response regulator [Actinoplanes octamycinicus]|uniref:DNA-binding NarL/FixJ family response regulator n=1 Tax=Actinoplanes octamycinicus TaxID=135948 RepID=A0A7W7H3T5_9ACTN|nr:response regulator transcription factor [Actinoplanes octamycinicus]MBB4743495.1 DNA-binding NarL/FixJ family response regulator [Actinoplanes octamycinicus]GIE62519.1 DNA-binding response regulator [Actinoplanes octamycinicus]
MTISVVIADDQRMLRAGLRMVIETEPDMLVVGEAGDGAEAVAVARRLRPDVVLMDIAMPRQDGLTATRTLLAQPGAPRIIVLTTFDTDENLYRALRAGASGFLLKVSSPEHLITAIRVVAAGEALLDPAVTTRVISAFADRPGPTPPPELGELTPREADVLRLMARGRSNGEIAAALTVGEATVKTHVARVLMKLRLRDRVQAVVYAYESGLIRAGEPPDGPRA